MQTPSAADPSFKAFLDKLQEQNIRGFATQLVQLKADRENVGKDNDKREEQLDEVVDSLKQVQLAVTGIKIDVDITPLVNIGENQTKLLEELIKEASLTRKLTEGSVEYDKEAAQYRNTSGKEIESVVSGKTSKKGGFLDFETARDTLSGQGKRVREDNKFDLKPINYVPGKMAGKATGVDKAKDDKEEDNTAPDLRGFFVTLLDELDAAPGRVRDYLIDHEEKPEVKKKEREAKVSSERQAPVSIENPEADNIRDSQEVIADNSKSDLELSKQMLDTTREQLTVLKEIRDALTPKTPGELSGGNGPPSPGSKVAETEEGGGLGLGDALTGLGGLAKKAGGAIATGAKAVGKGALSLGGGIAKFAASGAGRALGATAAVGLGAYTAYKGYTAAEDSKQVKLEEVQTQFDAGKITSEQAAAQRKEIGNTATVEKSGAVGEGTGMAGGAIAGGLAGAKLGAAIGSIIPGAGTVVGAGIGTIAGGALGAFAGSKAGKYVGEKVGSGINAVKGFFGGEEKAPGAATKEAVSGSTAGLATKDSSLEELQAARAAHLKRAPDPEGSAHAIMHHKNVLGTIDKAIEAKKSNPTEGESRGAYAVRVSKLDAHKKRAKEEKYDSESVEALQEQRIRVAERGPATDSLQSKKAHERVLGSLDKAIEDKKNSKPTENKLSEVKSVTPVEGVPMQGESKGKVNSLEAEATRLGIDPNQATGTYSGGALTKITDKVSGKEYPVTVPEASKARVEAASNLKVKTGSDVAKTSTENLDMARETMNGRGNNTVVSNNVSNNETTKFMPSKPSPRPEFTGSALDRYLNKTAVY